MILTPNGRWEVRKPICLSATSHHQETWDPNWNLRTLVIALRGHMISQPNEIGGILTSSEAQKTFARSSKQWRCPTCGASHPFLDTGIKSSDDLNSFTELKPLTARRSSKTTKVKRKHNRRTLLGESVGLRIFKVLLPLLLMFMLQAISLFSTITVS